MDYQFHNQNRNYGLNFDHNWRGPSNVPLHPVYPGTTALPRNLFFNYTAPRMNENFRGAWNLRNNRRRPVRHVPSINEMRNSIRRATQEMYDAHHDFDNAKFILEEAKCRLATKKQETIQMRTDLQNSIQRLERILNNFQSPRMLNSLCLGDRSMFQQEIQGIRQEIEEARLRIREFELEHEEESGGTEEQITNESPNVIGNPGIKRLRFDHSGNPEPGCSTSFEEKDKSDDLNCCTVCMENPANSVLYACGHICMCFQCSRKLLRRRGDTKRCPMCRAVIRDIIKIYKS